MGRAEFNPGSYWSHTLGVDLDDCMRRVYYRVYGSWGGWRVENGEIPRTLYTLKASDNLPTYSGSMTHNAIQAIMHSVRSRRKLGTKQAMLDRLEERMRQEISYSASLKWKGLRNPKKATLILRNHLLGEDLHSTDVDLYIARARDALEAFLDNFFPALLELDPVDILLIDSLDSIEHRGYRLFLVPDLVTIRPEDRKRVVIDWKTGTWPNVDQLKAYAMHLIAWTQREKAMALEPDQIVARSVTLLNPENEATLEVTQAHIDEAMARIDRDIDLLEAVHDEGLERNETAFPKTEHTGSCEYCIFKMYCDTRP